MREQRQENVRARRDVLKLATLGAVASAAGAVAAAEPARAASEPRRERGYRLSAHVETYYATARF